MLKEKSNKDIPLRTHTSLLQRRRIEPSSGWPSLQLRELWEYRDLLLVLTWRDISVLYKQTLLGISWALIQPFMTMVVFSIFFGSLAKVPSDGLPYPIFAYSGLIPWTLFSRALTNSANSLIANQGLVSKVYFPKIIIPLSTVLSGLVDFAIAFLILIAMMLYYGIVPTSTILVLPLYILFTIMTATSVGLWLSALNVHFRDVRYTLPFLTQFWLLITPIAYSTSLVPDAWKPIYGLNPMASIVDGFRWALLQAAPPSTSLLIPSIAAVIILFISGLYYFQYVEKTFADVV